MLQLLAAGAGILGSVLGASSQKKALNKQLEAQKYATDQQLSLQRDALAQQQQNLAPYLNAGYGALSQLQSQFGLGAGGSTAGAAKPAGGMAGTSPMEGAASGVGQPDWGDYLTRYTDVAQEYQAIQADPARAAALQQQGINSPEAYAQYHATQVAPALGEQRTVNTTQAAPQAPAGQYGPQVDPRQTYTRPDQGAAPAMPDLSAAAYQKSPGYEAGLLSGQRNLNANFAARGLLGSGAGAEAAIKFGTDYQNQDYNTWKNAELAKWQAQTQQFNVDRNNTNTNFGSDRAYGTGVYDADRSYGTDRFDTQANDLFRLVGAGNPSQANAAIQNNANNVGGLLQNSANNMSNIYGQQAANTGGLIGNLTGIGQGLLANGGLNFGSMFGGSSGGSNPLLNWSSSWGGGS